MADAFIFDHLRTPRGRGKSDGALHAITPVQLASQTLSALRDRNHLDTALVDDVVFGCVSPVGEQGANIARVSVLAADYAESVAGQQVNRFCASGLEAVNIAAAQIMSGQSLAVIGGGVESMSRVAMGADGGAWYADPTVSYQLHYVPQGIGADLISTMDGFTRPMVDAFAVQSQQRAARAWSEGRFAKSILSVRNDIGEVVLSTDEHMRPDASVDSLAQLKPAFLAAGEKFGFDTVAQLKYPHIESITHVHTAGNSSGIVDGAAAVLLGGQAFAEMSGLKPRAKIRAFTSIGSEPAIMLTGPALVTEKLLARAGMSINDIDLFEVNEAFAAVVMRFMRHFDLTPDRVNVNGGAIAMGHPLGATGAMILGTVLDELERQDLNTALITLCVGAGMGTATIIERV